MMNPWKQIDDYRFIGYILLNEVKEKGIVQMIMQMKYEIEQAERKKILEEKKEKKERRKERRKEKKILEERVKIEERIKREEERIRFGYIRM